MAYPSYIREKARQLRSDKKLTIDEISERLAIPRTTIYGWVKDLEIPRKPNAGWSAVAQKKGTAAMRSRYRALREKAYEQGRREFSVLTSEPTFRDFVCMYIGEGYKRDRNVVAICNSDPAVVRLGAYWIRRFTEHPIAFAFQHHADQDPAAVCEFWGQLLKVDADKIKFQRKSNSGELAGRNWRSRYGVLQVRTSDTYLRARLGAWMDAVRNSWP
jgi:predicted DNA-binding transcriptional regulator AlpA